eukprot:5041271-Alexandrium_andersonii.AAC.1
MDARSDPAPQDMPLRLLALHRSPPAQLEQATHSRTRLMELFDPVAAQLAPSALAAPPPPS